jgi:predicted exporter
MARPQSFTGMSLDELVLLREQIGSAIDERADALRAQLASLDGRQASARRGRPPGRRMRRYGKVAAKYRDPKTGATWSGRGAPARWLSEYEKQGKKRDQFLIAGNERTPVRKMAVARKKVNAKRSAPNKRGRPRKKR